MCAYYFQFSREHVVVGTGHLIVAEVSKPIIVFYLINYPLEYGSGKSGISTKSTQ